MFQKVAGIRRYAFVPVEQCEMCGSAAHRVLGLRLNRSQGLNPAGRTGIAVGVKRCRDCGLTFADPRPIPGAIEDHYGVPPEGYWSPKRFEPDPSYFQREIAEAKRLLPFQEGMSALDIGAGFGKAMTALSAAGFDTWGLEPSEPFRDRAIEKMGIPADRLALSTVEAFNPVVGFDFITFGAVLEHLQEPARALERAMAWLKPGGIIQAEVPSSDWLVSKLVNGFFRLRGTNYVTNLSPMHSPFHLYEFGLKSFQAHAAKAGYEIAHHHYMVCSIPHVPKPLKPLLREVMARTNTGMQLVVYLKRS